MLALLSGLQEGAPQGHPRGSARCSYLPQAVPVGPQPLPGGLLNVSVFAQVLGPLCVVSFLPI